MAQETQSPNYADICEIYKRNLVTRLEIKGEQNQVCKPCIASKMHSNPFVASQNRAPKLLDLIHSDIHDVGHLTFSGFQYWGTGSSSLMTTHDIG